MNSNVQELIENNIQLIDDNRFDVLYEEALKYLSIREFHVLTDILLSSGIDPLYYIDNVPPYYLAFSPITELTIPDNITTINGSAFAGSHLKNVDLSHTNIDTIRPSAFRDCERLKSFIFPSKCIDIGTGCLSGCGNLEKVVLSNEFSYIPGLTFSQCHSLKEIMLPDTITKIGARAFHQCHPDLQIYVNKGRPDLQIFGEDKWLFERAIVEI